MTIQGRASVFALLIAAGLLSAFAVTGAVAAAWLWLWFGLAGWLALGKPVWTRGALPNLMVLFFFWVATSVWWSRFPYSSWYAALIINALSISFLAWQLTPSQDKVWEFLKKGFVVGTWLVSLWGIYQVVFLDFQRASGPVADPNAYACLLNLAWFPLLASFYKADLLSVRGMSFVPTIVGASLLIVALGFFAASSRGAMLAWLLLMPIALSAFRCQPNFIKKTLIVLSLVAASYLMISVVTKDHLLERAGLAYLEQDASVALRLSLWRATADMFLANPWIGTGLGTWVGVYPAYRQAADNSTVGYYAHNDYLQIAQEGGLVTIAIFVLILFLMARLTIRVGFAARTRPDQIENLGLMLGVMAAYVHAAFNFIFYLIYLNIIVGIYGARAWQSGMNAQTTEFMLLKGSGTALQRLVIVFALTISLLQIGLHEAGEALLNGSSRTLAVMRQQFPQLTPFGIARVIAAVRPDEYIAKRYLLESTVQALYEVDPRAALLKQAILREAIEQYDDLRSRSANSADLGAEEAKLLLRSRHLLPGNNALQQARLISLASLRVDPRHVESTITLAESYYLGGEIENGDRVLAHGISNMIFLRDRLILQAELLKYQNLHEETLTSIQEKLRGLRFACKISDCQENRAIEKEQQTRLRKLAYAIMPFSNVQIGLALSSLIESKK